MNGLILAGKHRRVEISKQLQSSPAAFARGTAGFAGQRAVLRQPAISPFEYAILCAATARRHGRRGIGREQPFERSVP